MKKRHDQPALEEQRGAERRRGISLIEWLIVITIILIVVAIAAPYFGRRQISTETVVINELMTIDDAQTIYYSSYGKYAANLSDLGPPTGGSEGPRGANLISRALAHGAYRGYRYSTASRGNTFSLTAVPETFDSARRRSFFMDQTKTIHENYMAEPANANSPEMR